MEAMKIAFIPPYSLLRYTERTNYQLCLPHLMSSNSYKLTYHNYCKDQNQFVIMDNGAAEDRLVELPVLAHLADKMRPDEVVIPDVMGDMVETIEAAMLFHDEVVPPQHMGPLPYRLMFVVQGQTMEEVIKSAKWATSQTWINTIGIPRHLLTTLADPYARSRVANILQGNKFCKDIHFLGANADFPHEVEILTDPQKTLQDHIRGMDTSMPFNYAFANIYIADRSGKTAPRPERYFYMEESAFPAEVVEENVNYFLKFAEGVGTE